MTSVLRRQSVTDPEKAARAIRARGLTLEQFAAVAEVSRKTLGDWLAGRRTCHLATELKIVRALRDWPVVLASDPDAASWSVAMPPHARTLVGVIRSPGSRRRLGGRRLPDSGERREVARFMVGGERGAFWGAASTGLLPGAFGRPLEPVEGREWPSVEAYEAALGAEPALRAWRVYGYRLLPSGRAGEAFMRALVEGRYRDAFPDAAPGETWSRLWP